MLRASLPYLFCFWNTPVILANQAKIPGTISDSLNRFCQTALPTCSEVWQDELVALSV